jgi:uncharacterized membrane protein YfhO
VTVDGQPAELYRVNYGLRGVFVPAGEHTVRMEYHSASIQAGFTVSIISLVAVLALLLWTGLRAWRKPGSEAVS